MLGIVLSVIIILGMPGGPTSDFNDAGGTNNSVTAAQSTNTVQHKK